MKKVLYLLISLTLVSCQNDIQSDHNATVYEGTSADLLTSKEVFASNDLIFSTDDMSIKRGDGKKEYADLPYINPGLQSGTYLPSTSGLAYGTNLQMGKCNYIRIGNIVTVTGSFSVSFNGYQDRVNFNINLPVESDSVKNISGTVAGINMSQNSTTVGWVRGANSPSFNIKAGNSGVSNCCFTLSYTLQ